MNNSTLTGSTSRDNIMLLDGVVPLGVRISGIKHDQIQHLYKAYQASQKSYGPVLPEILQGRQYLTGCQV